MHSPPWSPGSTESRAVHLFLPCTQEHRVEGHAYSSTVPQEHRDEGCASFSSPVPQEHRVESRTSHSSPIAPFSSSIAPFSSPIAPFPSSITLVSYVTVLINVDTLVEEAADTVCNTGLDIGGVIIENVDSSDAEEGRIDRFRSDGCKCQLSGGDPCHTLFTATQIRAACDKCNQLTHDQLDMVVMGQLRSSCRNDRVTLKSKVNITVRQRLMTLFHFGGHHICHTFFLFLRAMGTKRFKAIKQSWLERRLCPRIALKILLHNTTIGYQMSNA